MDQHVTLADDELWGAPAPAPAGEDGGKKSHVRRWVVALAGTAAIGVAAVVGANLASSSTRGLATAGQGGPGQGGPGGFGGFGGRGNNGTIASIDGATITMTTDAGATVKVITSASTTVTVSSTGALGDVKVGDNVRVAGTTSGTTVAADQITDSGTTALADGPGGGRGGPPPANGALPANANGGPPANGFRGAGGPPTTGVVKTVNGSTFTIAATDGSTLTVTTSSAAVVTVVKRSTVGALKVGDAIQVNGTTAGDGTITASDIRAGAFGAGR